VGAGVVIQPGLVGVEAAVAGFCLLWLFGPKVVQKQRIPLAVTVLFSYK